MTEAIPEDKSHKLADLSGVELRPGENPYTAFISACNNDHVGDSKTMQTDQI